MVTTNAKDVRKLREAEQRRKAIIKVVRKLIKKGGLSDVSLRKVAELAGFSTTVVYALFDDKATLITQAMDEDLLDLTRLMVAAAAARKAPLDRLRAMARAYIQFGITHPDEYVFVFMQPRPHAPNESARVKHGDPSQDPYAFVRGLVGDMATKSGLSTKEVDIDLMTQIIWEGIHGLTARHLVMGPDDAWVPVVPAESHVEAMIEVLLTGVQQHFKTR